MPVSFTEVGNDSGRNIINALIDSINGSKQQFLDVLDALVSEANEKLSEIDYEGGTTDGSHRTGLNEVPYDGYTAILHKGEMVLTQPEADRYQKGTKTALETVTQTNVNIEFKGSLAALGRVLKPIISKEETRVGKSLVEGA